MLSRMCFIKDSVSMTSAVCNLYWRTKLVSSFFIEKYTKNCLPFYLGKVNPLF